MDTTKQNKKENLGLVTSCLACFSRQLSAVLCFFRGTEVDSVAEIPLNFNHSCEMK